MDGKVIISVHAIERYIERVNPALCPRNAILEIRANLPFTTEAGRKTRDKFRWYGHNSSSKLLVYCGVGYLVAKNRYEEEVLATILLKNWKRPEELEGKALFDYISSQHVRRNDLCRMG